MLISEAIDKFKADRLAKGYAAGTVRGQVTTLRQLLADVGNIHVSSLQPQHMDKFWAKRAGLGAGTHNNKRNHLAVFFAWCRARRLMSRDEDPLEGTRHRRVPHKSRLTIPPDQWEDLLSVAPNPRDRALVALGLYTFCRVSELTYFRVSAMNLDKGVISVFREKTQTMDDLPICAELDYELKRWMFAYGEKVGERPMPGWYLLPPYEPPRFLPGTSIDGKGGYSVAGSSALIPDKRFRNATVRIKAMLRLAGHTDLAGEGGHTLRRSGARALYEELLDRGHDGSIRIVQGMLGHSNIATTERYLDLNIDRKTRNDLLAGVRMFRGRETAEVVPLDRGKSLGQASSRHLQM